MTNDDGWADGLALTLTKEVGFVPTFSWAEEENNYEMRRDEDLRLARRHLRLERSSMMQKSWASMGLGPEEVLFDGPLRLGRRVIFSDVVQIGPRK
jgi:hypothetical protein